MMMRPILLPVVGSLLAACIPPVLIGDPPREDTGTSGTVDDGGSTHAPVPTTQTGAEGTTSPDPSAGGTTRTSDSTTGSESEEGFEEILDVGTIPDVPVVDPPVPCMGGCGPDEYCGYCHFYTCEPIPDECGDLPMCECLATLGDDTSACEVDRDGMTVVDWGCDSPG